MRYLIVPICIWLSPIFLFSQIDSFDIASYARPDLRRTTASARPSFSLSTNRISNENSDVYKSFHSNLGGTYSQTNFVNTDSPQVSWFLDASIWYSSRQFESKGYNMYNNIQAGVNYRFY